MDSNIIVDSERQASELLRRTLIFVLLAAGDEDRARDLTRLPEADAEGWHTHWLKDLPWVSTEFLKSFQTCESAVKALKATLMELPRPELRSAAMGAVAACGDDYAGVHARRKDNLAPEVERRVLAEGVAHSAESAGVDGDFRKWCLETPAHGHFDALQHANSMREIRNLRPALAGKPGAEELEKALALCKLEEILLNALLAGARHCNSRSNAVRPAFDYASKRDSDGNEISRYDGDAAFESLVTADELVRSQAMQAYCYLHGWDPRLPESGGVLEAWFRSLVPDGGMEETDIPMRRYVAGGTGGRHYLSFFEDVLAAGFRSDIGRGVWVSKVSADAPVSSDEPDGETIGETLSDEREALPFEGLERQDDLRQALRVRDYLLKAIGQFDAKLYRFCRLVWDPHDPKTAQAARMESGIGKNNTNYVRHQAEKFLRAVREGKVFLPRIEEDRDVIRQLWNKVR